MKEYYSIGETANLLGVSTQTLRYYDRENILKPVRINDQTGYRYYSYTQFHVIDRIKYLQGFGLTLEEIGVIIQDGTVNELLPRLAARKEALLEQIRQSVEQIKDIDWYIDYFRFSEAAAATCKSACHSEKKAADQAAFFSESVFFKGKRIAAAPGESQ